eukprot:SAG31_NODE_4960_length_2834_cov_2.174040_5_plen_153_part_00
MFLNLARKAVYLTNQWAADRVKDFLGRLDERTMREHNARIYYIEDHSKKEDRQLKKDAQGRLLQSLAEKYEEMIRRDISEEGVYIAELRRKEKYKHPLDVRRHVRLAVGAHHSCRCARLNNFLGFSWYTWQDRWVKTALHRCIEQLAVKCSM